MLFELERYEESAITYDKITCLKSDDAAIYYKKGEAFLRANRDEEALASFEQVIRLDPPQRLNPPQTIVLHKQGKALFRCRRYEEALAIFKKVISLFAVIWSLKHKTDIEPRYVREVKRAGRIEPSREWGKGPTYRCLYKVRTIIDIKVGHERGRPKKEKTAA